MSLFLAEMYEHHITVEKNVVAEGDGISLLIWNEVGHCRELEVDEEERLLNILKARRDERWANSPEHAEGEKLSRALLKNPSPENVTAYLNWLGIKRDGQSET